MKVKCKKVGSNKSISLNNDYEVIDESDTRYAIINDRNIQMNYAKSLFDVVPEAPVVPEVPPVEVIDELNIETSIIKDRYVDDDDSIDRLAIKVTCPFIGRNRFEYNSGNILTVSGMNISCGILQIEGVDSLINSLNAMKIAFNTYMRNHANVFILNEEINVDELFKDITTSLVQDIIAEFQGIDGTAVILLSTTNDSINSSPVLKEALNEVASTVTTALNPNSGNNITLWTILTGHEGNNNEDEDDE
jgi:hypothetical protein